MSALRWWEGRDEARMERGRGSEIEGVGKGEREMVGKGKKYVN